MRTEHGSVDAEITPTSSEISYCIEKSIYLFIYYLDENPVQSMTILSPAPFDLSKYQHALCFLPREALQSLCSSQVQ